MTDEAKITKAITLLSEVVIKLVSTYPEDSKHVVKGNTYIISQQNIWMYGVDEELIPVPLNILYDIVLELLPAKEPVRVTSNESVNS